MWLILLIMGQKRIDFVCTGQTVCLCAAQQRDGRRVCVGGAVRSDLISQCDYIFMVFVYLPWMLYLRLPPTGVCVICLLCAVCLRSDPKYTLPTTITHMYTLVRTYNTPLRLDSSGHVCSPPAHKASSCSTYTHSFPSPPPSSHPLRLAPRVSGFLWDFLTRSLPPRSRFQSLVIHLRISLSAAPCVLLLINLSLPILLSLPLSRACFPWGRKERSWAVPAQGQEPEPSPFGFHYKLVTEE